MKKVSKYFKVILIVIVALVITAFLTPTKPIIEEYYNVDHTNLSVFGGNSGLVDDPYIIKDSVDMVTLATLVNGGKDFQGIYFLVESADDIISLDNFISIGTSTRNFKGHFNGNDTQFNLKINRSSISNIGLFGVVSVGSIKNLSVKGSVNGYSNVGAIVGLFSSGLIENVYNISNVTSNYSNAGGIVGNMSGGEIKNSFNNGKITSNYGNYTVSRAGGLAGTVSGGKISNSYNKGEIIGYAYIGGLIGVVSSGVIIENSYNIGIVSSIYTVANTGGVFGNNPSALSSSVYYDAGIIANFQQLSGYHKPANNLNTNYRSEAGMLTSNKAGSMVGSNWVFKEPSQSIAYYPEIKTFNNSKNTRVRNESLVSIEIDLSDGLGSKTYPNFIYNKKDMDELSHKVSTGSTMEGIYFKVSDDVTNVIDLGNFTSIGTTTNNFRGHFDGNDAQFKLGIAKSSSSNVGLFGVVSLGTISNLSASGSVTGYSNVGGIVGLLSSGSIENVYNLSNVTSNYSNAGGIVGNITGGEIRNTFNNGKITSNYGNYTVSRAGGLVGTIANGSISNSYNRGEVIGYAYIGGLVGVYSSNATIENSYNIGVVSSIYTVAQTGAVLGNNATIQNSSIYYDSAIIANFQQLSGYHKPANNLDTIYRSDGGELTSKKASSMVGDNWIFNDAKESIAYYPEIKAFNNSKNSRVNEESLKSIELDLGDGVGSETYPKYIYNKEDMDSLSAKVAAGSPMEGMYYKVSDDVDEIIDLGNFTSIGNTTTNFKGNFDGNHAQFKLSMNKTGTSNIGLFGVVSVGTIKNLSVSGFVTGYSNVGGIVGQLISGTIENVYNISAVTSNYSNAGGIVGNITGGEIRNTFNNGKITSNYGNYTVSRAGGLVGTIANGSISNSYNRGEVIGYAYIGGLVGVYSSNATIENSYNIGVVSSIYTVTHTGGVLGNNATIPNSSIYYDSAIIANFQQLSGYHKPANSLNTIYRSDGGELTSKKASSMVGSDWIFNEATESIAYYPEIISFKKSNNERVMKESLESIQLDLSDGVGSETYPKYIYNREDMQKLSARVVAGSTMEGMYYKVSDDVTDVIDLGSFTPIGNATYNFKGNFDGNHAQFKLKISSGNSNIGLFGVVSTGTIKNLSVSGSVTGYSNVGSIVGLLLSGTIENVYNISTVTSNYSNAGGLVGNMSGGEIKSSFNNGKVTSNYGNYTVSRAGGLVGTLTAGRINNSYNKGEVTGYAYIGGLIGVISSGGILENSYNTGIVSGMYTPSTTGALIGNNGNPNGDNVYYDATVLNDHVQSGGYHKPVDNINSPFRLEKNSMIWDGLKAFGFNNDRWTFKNTDTTFTYYPQIDGFVNSKNDRVIEDSLESVRSYPFTGEGTKERPYIIKTASDLMLLSNVVDNGFDTLNVYYEVLRTVSNLDMSTHDFKGVGNKDKPFKGFFNGSNVNVHLNMNNERSYQGLFGYASKDSVISNLSVSGNIRGLTNLGGITGVNEGKLSNVYSNANIIGLENIGGIAGSNLGTIEFTYNTGNINGSNINIGGLVGFNNGSIIESYSAGKVQGKEYVGGLIGFSQTDSNLERLYYNKTTIEYDDIISGLIKPNKAIGNINGLDNAGLNKDQMTGLDIFNSDLDFTSSKWVLTKTGGLYDYYPQLVSFATSTIKEIKDNSLTSVRVIRFRYGSGSLTNPYLIIDEDDMKALSDITKEGNSLEGIYFKVMDGVETLDLTIEGLEFEQIGHTAALPFKGHFDGNGVSIIVDLNKAGNNAGLFGYLNGSIVKNIFIHGSVIGLDRTGALAGDAINSTITNVYNKANVIGRTYVGGLVGVSSSSLIEYSYNHGDVKATGNQIGGLIGHSALTRLNYVYNYGLIEGVSYLGGIVGHGASATNITYAYNRNSVRSISTGSYMGGIIGSSLNGSLDNSYSAGVVSGKSITTIGGLIGSVNNNTIENNSYYDQSILDAEARVGFIVPKQAIGNKLNQDDVKSINKNDMVGLNGQKNMTLDDTKWVYTKTDGVDAYYPQLKVFANDLGIYVKQDSLESVSSYIFVGEGTETNNYIIVTKEDMVNLSNLVALGETFENIFFKVKESVDYIDLTYGVDYNPIGNSNNKFEGTFDGTGTDFNLKMNKNNNNYIGLFGYIGSSGKVRNLSVSGTVTGNDYVSGVAGFSEGLIENVYSTVVTYGNDYVGGITGYNMGHINNVFVIGDTTGNNYIGGLVGYNDGSISNGYSSSVVLGKNNLGGIVGHSATGNEEYLYYNLSRIDVSESNSLTKPYKAIGNLDDNESATGLTSNQLFTNTNIFDDNSTWVFEKSIGFFAYYPQLAVFAKGITIIKDRSKEVVTVSIFNEGDGSESNPYIIRNEHDMEAVSQMITSGYDLKNLFFEVAKDVNEIDLTKLETEYIPIGSSYRQFQGSFNGNGVIFNIKLTTNKSYQGLFGIIGTLGVVSNVATKGSVSGYDFVGGISGRNYGQILNSYNLADIKSTNSYSGGITGYSDNNIHNTFNKGNIEGVNYVGGIAGGFARSKQLSNSYNTGNVHASRTQGGGVVGAMGSSADNVYSTGMVTGGSYLGGVFGAISGAPLFTNAYYSIEPNILNTSTSNFAKSAIGNSSIDTVIGVYKNQLTGDQLFGLSLNMQEFVLKQTDNLNSYFPQLKVFSESNKEHNKENSLYSVINDLFYGEGTSESPYIITSSYDLRALGMLTSNNFKTKGIYFEVYKEANINFDTIKNNYYAIGNPNNPFEGIFNGNDVEINININNTNKDYQGLFGYIGLEGIVHNVTLTGTVNGKDYAGILSGYNLGQLKDIVIYNSTLNGNNNVGLLSGYSDNKINNISAKGTVNGNSNVGGLIGTSNDIELHTSYFMGVINATGNNVGGLIGIVNSNAIINTSFTEGIINAVGSNNVGGLVGSINEGELNNSYAITNITGKDNVGGIVGSNGADVKQVYYSGKLLGNNSIGGVIGLNINNGTLEAGYYNITEINSLKDLKGLNKPNSAISNIEDDNTNGSRTLENMTFQYPFGSTSEQMAFDGSLYSTKQGKDFTMYFPELNIFKNHTNKIFNDDSLASITYKKIEGDGSLANPFLIYDGFDMVIVDEFVSLGKTFKGQYFMVAPNVDTIDLTVDGLHYSPIGTSEFLFEATFLGNNATFIIDISLDNEHNNEVDHINDYKGIFNTLGISASVKDLTITGVINGASYIGGLAGRSFGTITNVKNYATINSHDGNDTGGIVGHNEGTITESTNYGIITSVGSYTGGIAGQSTKSITNSYNKGPVTGNVNVGGVVGNNSGIITNVYNNNSVTATNNIAGGIAGTASNEKISYSFNTGNVKAVDAIAAGIVGVLNEGATIEGVYNGGTIIAKNQAAGIVANFNGGSIYDSYHFGSVFGKTDLGIIASTLLSGARIYNTYYDVDRYNSDSLANYSKPTRVVGNHETFDGITGLYHGQMIGNHAIGNTKNNMNLGYKNRYVMRSSDIASSYYPQIAFFANHKNSSVKEDSLISVQTETFLVGDGSQNNPFVIRNESDWLVLADSTNSGNDYKGKYFIVSNEINELNFADSIDNYQHVSVGNENNPFNGIIDGLGINYKVKVNSRANNEALFGHIGIYGEVRNFSVSGSITGTNNTAGIASINKGLIESVYNQATITGTNNTAGISSINSGVIKNVYNKGKITGYENVGGILGTLSGILLNSYNSGLVFGRTNIGALVGFYELGSLDNSYYDQTILSAYRSIGANLKPSGAVGSSYNGNDVKGLDNRFMTGTSSLGTGSLNMNFRDATDVWSNTLNISGNNNYPQLQVFARNTHEEIRVLSNESTLNELFIINFDERNDEENNPVSKTVLANEHFELYIPTMFGYNFTGWYYMNEDVEVQITNKQGLSINTYNYDENILVYAKWEIAYHKVEFIDGNGKVLYVEDIQHGTYTNQPVGIIPTKKTDNLYVYKYQNWNFDFDNQMILGPTKIYANYEQINRYYEVVYFDGDGNIFKIVKGEYETYLTPIKDIPAKTYHDLVAYKFVKWDYNFNDLVISDINIHPIFIEVDRYYEVNFYNGDVLIESKVGEYLFGVDAPNILPEKPSTPEFNYVFKGWDKEFSSIEADIDVYAVFEEVRREYTVSFLDGNNLTYSTQQVLYGSYAATPSGVPTKDYHDLVAYKFIGWDKDYTNITGDLTVLALFEEVDRYYTVNFYDANQDLLSSETVEYLSGAKAPQEDPTKESSIKHDYIFSGWDNDFDRVTSNLDIYPEFDEVLREYEVTFLDGNLEVFAVVKTAYGSNAIRPTGIPRKMAGIDIAYKFDSWDTNYTNITGDTKVHSNFIEVDKYYIVTFLDGNTILKTEKVEYGYSATAPILDLTHETEGWEYIFISWSLDFSFVEKDLEVQLNKKSQIKVFTVTFVNGDETTYQQINYNQNAKTPVGYKSNTDQITYKFIAWDKSSNNIKEDTIITAIFEEEFTYYEVRFFDGDGKLITMQKVKPEGAATAPLIVQKESNNEFVYIFIGWNKDYSFITEDLIVTAIFKEVSRWNTVKFYDSEGNVISEQLIEFGLDAILPLPPVKEAEGKYEFEFIGWDNDTTNITSDLDIHPIFEAKEKEFKVEFLDGNGNVISTQYIKYGLNAIAPSSATKESTSDIYYVFVKFEDNYLNITSDRQVNSIFTAVDRWYTVEFIGEDGLLDTQVIEYGKSAVDPIPYLGYEDIDDDFIRVVTGWDTDFSNVTSNLTINAIYGVVKRYYDVEFFNGSESLGHFVVHYGSTVVAPNDPTKEGNNDYLYIFNGWDTDFSFITDDLNIYATYLEVKARYTVTFLDGDGNTFDTQLVDYGKDARSPGIPNKTPTSSDMYIFIGWDIEFDIVTEDLIVTPIFTTEQRTFVVIFKDHNGNILKEQRVAYGTSATAPTNLPTKPNTEKYEYTSKWDKSFNKIVEDTVVELMFIETLRVYTITFLNSTNGILSEVQANYEEYISFVEGEEKATDEKYTYKFIGWNPTFNELVTESITYTPVYERTLRLYSVKFIDGNTDLYEEQFIPYGQTPNVPKGTPIKDPTQQYYYIFRMWETTTIKVYQDLEINAIFYSNLQEYKVSFVDEFGNLISSGMVKYGTGATEPESWRIPVKQDTHEYTYVFAGWDKGFSYITEDIVVKTIYIGSLRKFTYTFYDDDQVTILKQIVGNYGDRIIPPKDPFKEPTESQSYIFIGWDKVVEDILTKDVTFIAVYNIVPKTFRVIFMDGNGLLFEAQEVNYGEGAATPKGIPSKNPTLMYQYVFEGWIEDYSSIKGDLTVTAKFRQELRQYEVKFIVDKVSETKYVSYGESAYDLVPTPQKVGHRFIQWDKDLSRITKDTETNAIFEANSYYIEFKDGFKQGDTVLVEGSMKNVLAKFGSTIKLPELGFTRKGYMFVGWVIEGNDIPSFYDQEEFVLEESGLILEALWITIIYNINYELDGGFAINPEYYTVEQHIVLQQAQKAGHKFLGWYLESINEDKARGVKAMNLINNESILVEELNPGTIGNITLTARYKYDGYIQLKDESTLGLFYADIVSTIPIEERESFDEENPVFLLGVFLGQTLENLRENFINDNLIFVDKNGNPVADDKKVTTGYQIRLIDEESGVIIDQVHIILKGDVNGDGIINVFDYNMIINHITSASPITDLIILSANINTDNVINVFDYNALINHITGAVLIHDPNITSTMQQEGIS